MSEGGGMGSGDLVRVEVASLGLDKASNTPVVILREVEGERLLPIWIGPAEASAIAMELAGIKFSRPLTHDLVSTIVGSLGSELVRVLITRVEENTYFASLVFRRNGEMISIDSRPSDSVALALRAAAPIFASAGLLGRTQLEIDQPDEDDPVPPWMPPEGESEPAGASEGEARPTGESLREYLKGLDPEDFGKFVP
ncbi:MAG: bifunctional nuclease family protein [marine benthic group bacterium]|nr:bifunctional nuclease family protein [Gemmatimonadota bacterium]MCL7963115.1 bifunctional nuclease family protein [Candidatus Carthagonibacter metallireducens]MCL7957029.1 bifunctional nuclease family protein [Gemmatimonadota bacterium]MCL7963852.1 bifunctional nuclease family protein [Gemmatimonadota bacterium]MCL7967061.1 bifunctional nuclease family protein [Gemmatimonadota bacterium]